MKNAEVMRWAEVSNATREACLRLADRRLGLAYKDRSMPEGADLRRVRLALAQQLCWEGFCNARRDKRRA